MEADRLTLLQNAPPGTLLRCVKQDFQFDFVVERDELVLVLSHTEYSTMLLCLDQGIVFETFYGRHSLYAKMLCYDVYTP